MIFEDTVIFGDGLMEIGHGAFMDAHHFMRFRSTPLPRRLRTGNSLDARSWQLCILARDWRRLGWEHLENAHRYMKFWSPVPWRWLRTGHFMGAQVWWVWVLRWNWRVCVWRVNAGLVESWGSREVFEYILIFSQMQHSKSVWGLYDRGYGRPPFMECWVAFLR